MASRFRAVLKQGLESFQKSGTSFNVLLTVGSQAAGQHEAKTLFILDSSFNPPSIAHQSLAESALKDSDGYAKPHRLLLLFSTMNADKAPSPAAFDQRLTLMALLATDLSQQHSIPIDIGVTTAPYYTDKSLAIENDGLYAAKPKHVHLIGYDTMTRVFTAKYYQKFSPPFSALNPYFDAGHEFRMTLRPDDDGLDKQRLLLQDLAEGKLARDGGQPEWAKQVHIVPPNPRAGVSSTKIRDAAESGEWSIVQELCPPSVAEYVQQEKLYE